MSFTINILLDHKEFSLSHNSGSCSNTPIKSKISSKCSLNLFAFSPFGSTKPRQNVWVFYFCAIGNNLHILIIGTVWPEPGSSAAGSRMLQLIEQFKLNSWEVTFASAAADSEFAIDLNHYDVKKASIQLNHSEFDEFLIQLKPDVVMFDRFMTEEQYGWRVDDCLPDALKILDTEDLHCLRHARLVAHKAGRAFQISDLQNEIAKREIASILRCDLSLVISEFEMHLLTEFFKIDTSLLLYLPFMFDQISADHPSFDQRKDFITIGNFLHEPNWDSILFLKEEIWPQIRKLFPDVKLNIYGAYPSQKVIQLHQPKDGFLIKGRAEAVEPVMQNARVCLAPLRFGAGLKGKLIDAMRNGTPSVTTTIGAEGLNIDNDWCGMIADDAKDIAEQAVRLYTDKDLWDKAQKKGVYIYNKRFDKIYYSDILKQSMARLKTDISHHRLNNFLGQILKHQQHAATKYMSRWIELKNQSNR